MSPKLFYTDDIADAVFAVLLLLVCVAIVSWIAGGLFALWRARCEQCARYRVALEEIRDHYRTASVTLRPPSVKTNQRREDLSYAVRVMIERPLPERVANEALE
jgi:hypothetical protein